MASFSSYDSVDEEVVYIARTPSTSTWNRTSSASVRLDESKIFEKHVVFHAICQFRDAVLTVKATISTTLDAALTKALAAFSGASNLSIHQLRMIHHWGVLASQSKSMFVSAHHRTRVKFQELYIGSCSSINQCVNHACFIVHSRSEAAKQSLKAFAEPVLHSLHASATSTRIKASATATRTKHLVAEQPIIVGATSGAVLLGAGGGVVGFACGSLVGVACGVPLAFVTLGLSIPLSAAVGGSAGACGGAIVGSAAGVAVGSVVGIAVRHSSELTRRGKGGLKDELFSRILPHLGRVVG